MTSVINFNQQTEEMQGLSVLHLHDLFPDIEEVVYMYENEYLGIVGMPSFLGHRHLVSIEVIRKYIKNQLFNKPTILDEFGLACADDWDDIYEDEEFMEGIPNDRLIGRNDWELVICREGAFSLDETGVDYKWVGKFNQLHTERLKRIVLLKDLVVMEKDKPILLREGSKYTIVDEKKVVVGTAGRTIEMLTIDTHKERIAIPNNPAFSVIEADYAVIEYPEEINE